MGWINDEAPEHEGYVRALVAEGHDFRELGYPRDTESVCLAIRYVRVACDCGWRSPRIAAPFNTEYHPYVVSMPEESEERARLIWREHIRTETAIAGGRVL